MTYLVSHSHKPEACQQFKSYTADWFKSGFPSQIKQAYLQPGEHTYFFEVEAESVGQVYDLFRPMEEFSCQRLSPVLTKQDLEARGRRAVAAEAEAAWLEQEIYSE